MKVLRQLISRLITRCTHDIHVWLSYLKCCRCRRHSLKCRFREIQSHLNEFSTSSHLTERSEDYDC